MNWTSIPYETQQDD